MERNLCKLRYLPHFERDLEKIVDYIQDDLQNPAAAERFVTAVEEAIQLRRSYPEAFQAFYTIKKREHPYYRISVGNYEILYVIIGDVMEVRRIFYRRQNWRTQLKLLQEKGHKYHAKKK